MNLVNMLMNSMNTESSVEALSAKAGTSKKQTSSFLQLALPILINYLTHNASSQSGAQSLANALTQHTDMSSMVQQFGNADTQDGNAIISHILGNDSDQVVSTLAQQTNMDQTQVQSLLGNMAPGLMSGLSAATTSAQNAGQSSDGFDFSDLMGSFVGASQAEPTQAEAAESSLLSGLFGAVSGQSSGASSGLGMLGSLLGADSSGNVINSGNDGTSLISSLLGMLK